MQIQQFNNLNVKSLRVDIEEALKAVAEKYGINLELKRIGYLANKFNTSLVGNITTAAALDKNKSDEELESKLLGFDSNIIGKTLILQGRTFTITKLAINRPKFPIVVTDKNGKMFKLTTETVKRALK